MLGLHDRVVHLGVVDLADDVERMIVGHGPETPVVMNERGVD